MNNCHCDPRRHGRVPMSGDIQWRSGLATGIGEILDMSPGGAGFNVPVREAFQIGPSVALNTELAEGLDWRVTGDATITHKTPHNDGTCRIGVEFAPLRAESEPSDETPSAASV